MKKNPKHAIPARLTAILLAALLALTAAAPALAAEANVIHIRTAGDLTRLAEQCALDTWSQGKTVVLEADLTLGADFAPIPTFGGTFDGGGHTISGLQVVEGLSSQGLFRYIQEGGVVKNLTVRGTLTARNGETCLGGITGTNAGTILDCTFSGSVSGREYIGGITGINDTSGSLYRCTAEGSLTGERFTGGITGENDGTVTGCVNRASVNTAAYDPQVSLEDTLSVPGGLESLDLRDTVAGEATELLDTTTDTGGIAGYSTGILRGCRNQGAVGYPHVGYNVGGIAGRSSGYLTDCVNEGTVLGRKDVGGVAGQMAPNILLIFSQDTISQLDTALDDLDTVILRTLDHAQENSHTISGRLEDLSGYTDTASDAAADLLDLTADWGDDSLQQVNDLAEATADALDSLAEITAGSEDLLHDTSRALDLLRAAADSLSASQGKALREALDRLEAAGEQAQTALKALQGALNTLGGALVAGDPAALAQALEQLEKAQADLTAALEQVQTALRDLLQATDDQAIQQALEKLAAGLNSAAQATGDGLTALRSALSSLSLDSGALQSAFQQAAQAAGSLGAAAGNLKAGFSALGDALESSNFADAAGNLGKALDLLRQVSDDLAADAGDAHELLSDLADRDTVSFETPGGQYQALGDTLHGAVSGMGEQLDLLRQDASGAADTLTEDLRDLESRFRTVTDLLLSALTDNRTPDLSGLWEDVSEEEIQSTTLGKAQACSNHGTVEGDLSVGGIAGSMAVEYDLDPEDDITRVGTESLQFRYETRSVLQACVNDGAVTAKKDDAGGVVGRMDLGYVLGCENYGSVESTDGEYVGGIAGSSASVIRDCWAKCTVAGRSRAGGIAGSAYRLYGCTALVSVEAESGCVGAVAGVQEEGGVLSGNRYVSREGLAAVDGISYAGAAEPVDYPTLAQEALPEGFRIFTVSYETDGTVVQRRTYRYGDDLTGDPVPPVPEKEGCFGAWEEPGETTITFDHVLQAVYTPYVTTLGSTARRDETRSVFLAEGDFGPDARLTARQETSAQGSERWSVTLEDTEAVPTLVRFTPPADWEDLTLLLVTEDGTRSVDWEWEGSCCVFAPESASFTLMATQCAGVPWILLCALALLALAAGAVVLVRRRKRKGRAAQAQPEAAARS